MKSNIQSQELEFLDVLIYKGENFQKHNTFDTKVYFKPTDSHALLHKQSFHPKHTFAGIIKSQLVRFGRICQLESDFDEATSILFHALYPRGYSHRFLRSIKAKTKLQFFPPDHLSGMTPCGKRICTICKHVNDKQTISVNSTEIKLTSNGNCDTKRAIYLLGCRKCPNTYYVGQTINLRHRFIRHRSSVRTNKDVKVYKHFQEANHGIDDLTITILEIPTSDKPEILDKLERQWIGRLNTFELGLNSDPGIPERDTCTLVLQYHPTSNRIINTAREWLTKFTDKNKKSTVNLVKANARNKNLSQNLVRAMLREPVT